MSYFARVSENQIVTEIILLVDDILLDSDGVAQESLGVAFIHSLSLPGFWLQCSDDGSIRKNFPGIGFTYDADRDAFIPPQPYASWVLDEDTCLWVAPIAYPAEGDHVWDEQAGDWVEVTDETV